MSYSFPRQNLTRAEKIKEYGSEKEFGIAVLESLTNFRAFSSYSNEEWKIHENYNLLEGRFNKENYQDSFNFFGDVLSDFKMPAELEHYDLMTPIFEQLRGEEVKRPFNHKVVSTNEDSVTRVQELKNAEIRERMEYDLQMAMQEKQLSPQQPQEEFPPRDYPEIQRFYEVEYRDKIEILAASSLEYLQSQLHLDWHFNEGWSHYLKSGREIYWTGIIEGEPRIRVVDPRMCAYELSSGIENIENSTWFIEWRFLTAADCHEEYHSDLTADDVDKIEELKGNLGRTRGDSNLAVYNTGDYIAGVDNVFKIGNETLLKVARAEYMGLRKMGFVTYIDDDGQIEELTVDEEFKKSKFQYEILNIEWKWINEPQEATRIGDDIYVHVRPLPNSDFSLDNLSRRKLQYVGTTSRYCLVEKMKQWNLLYDAIMMKMKQEIITSMGQVAVFDVTQIPRSEGFDMDKWLYYLNVFKIGFINSQEEGQRGKASGFNQWKTMNLAHSEMINQYMAMAAFLEQKLNDIIGMTPQRKGQIAASETVGGVERSVQNSSYITEYMFYTHGETKRRTLERLLDVAKFAWKDGKKAFYAHEGDATRRVLEVEPGQFAHENVGVFVEDKGHDHEAMQVLRQAALSEIQSGNGDMRNIISVLKTDNLAKMERSLDEVYKNRAEQQQAQSQAEAQNAQAAAQAGLEADMAKEQFKEQNENARNTQDNETKLAVAQIQFTTKTNDANRNGVSDVVEAQLKEKELALQEAKDAKELALKDRELDLEDKWKTEELAIKKQAGQQSKKSM